MVKTFKNRKEAGRKLVNKIKELDPGLKNPVVLALPRGGVPVAYEIAKKLDIPLDVIISRKVGAPFNPEFAVGALSESNITYFNKNTLQTLDLDETELDSIIEEENKELQRRIETYRKGRKLPKLKNKTVLLVDDGLATGATALAAIKSLKKLSPKRVIFCSPVCANDSIKKVEKVVDETVCILKPKALGAIGAYYKDFGQTSDDKVIELLSNSERLI